MGWTKHASAVLAYKARLTEVRAELRPLVGKLDGREAYRMAVRLLLEHERLCSALAFGHRDGTIKAELGVTVGYKHKDMGLIVQGLIEHGPSYFTFRRAA